MQKIIIKSGDDRDAIFYYLPNILNASEQSELMEHLDNMNDFIPCTNYNGKSSRYQKWYQKDGQYFCPKWKVEYPRWKSFEYDDQISNIQTKIIDIVKPLTKPNLEINSCLINRYNDGREYIHAHRDSCESFGEYPVIIGLSVGAARNINFNKIMFDPLNPKSMKKDKTNPMKFSFCLESGSIFIMSGSSQKYFSHEIPKCESCDKRYSLTFRNFIYQ